MKKHPEITVVETIKALPGKTAGLKKALLELVPLCRKDEGCLQYELLEPVADSLEFLILMRWKKREDLTAHESSPPVLAFMEKYDGILYKEFAVSEWRRIL